eukprot:14318883-Alexandrium_andersonii.AAC.1
MTWFHNGPVNWGSQRRDSAEALKQEQPCGLPGEGGWVWETATPTALKRDCCQAPRIGSQRMNSAKGVKEQVP